MLLQIQMVSTVISHTEMQRENVIENLENAIQVRVRVQVQTRKKAMEQTQLANLELQTLKMCQNGNQTIHKVQQCTAHY